MVGRLVRLLLVRYAGGPAQAALYLTIWSFVRKRLRSDEVIEVQGIRPGERFVIEHLEISHTEQIKQLKREEERAKRRQAAARKAEKRARKEAKAARRARVREAERQAAS